MSLGILILGCERKETPKAEEVVRAIKTYTVAGQASGQVRKFSGVLQAADKTPLSFRVGGLVKSVNVKFGDRVEKGQVVATLDKTPFELQLKEKEGELAKARATVRERKTNFERNEKLMKEGIVSKRVYDSAKADYETSRIAVSVSETAVRLAQRDLSYTVLRAPYDGFIAKRELEPFQEVKSGQTILEMHGGGVLEVATNVPESLIHFIEKDQAALVSILAQSDLLVQGLVVKIGTVSGSANSFPVNIKLMDPPDFLRPGMTAEVAFHFDPSRGQAAYLIPFAAILEGSKKANKSGEGYVFVYDPLSSTVQKKAVKGRNMRDNLVEIFEGVKEGDIIAVAGVNFLRDGQKVKLMKPATR